jgi:splicing suppressor protein 51
MSRDAWYGQSFLLLPPSPTERALYRSTRTDQLIRIEAAMNGTTSDNSRRLIPCPECNLSFCCSPAHWEAARALHHAPCEDSCDGRLSQCEMNRETRVQIKFETWWRKSHKRDFLWVPPRCKSEWVSLAGLSWEGEFCHEMRRSVVAPESWPMTPSIRAASDSLGMAMTILYGLEKLNDSDAWTRQQTLTVHVGLLLFPPICCFPILSGNRSSPPPL